MYATRASNGTIYGSRIINTTARWISTDAAPSYNTKSAVLPLEKMEKAKETKTTEELAKSTKAAESNEPTKSKTMTKC